jgi:hypothetical protein
MSKQDPDVSKRNGDDDDDFAPIFKLAEQIAVLQEQARSAYQPIVDDIIRSGCRDVHKIEHALDGLLSFAGSDTCLPLFRRLCRYYWDIDPVAAAEYVLAYREMWDSEE